MTGPELPRQVSPPRRADDAAFSERRAASARTARNVLILVAVCVQSIGLISGIFFLLTIPLSGLLVIGAVLVEAMASYTAPVRQTFGQVVLRALLVFVGATAAVAVAEQAASHLCTQLGHDMKSLHM
jgi:hypothetical protein